MRPRPRSLAPSGVRRHPLGVTDEGELCGGAKTGTSGGLVGNERSAVCWPSSASFSGPSAPRLVIAMIDRRTSEKMDAAVMGRANQGSRESRAEMNQRKAGKAIMGK